MHASVVGELSVSTGPGDDINPESWLFATWCSAGCVDGLHGDVVGNGLVDLVSVNDSSVWVTLSTGTSFQSPTQWWPTGVTPVRCSGTCPYGNKATLLGDVSGDGKADLVLVNDNGTQVMLSTGSSFSSPVSWSSTPFFGTRATLLGDVLGNGKQDLIAVNDNSIYVMISTGTSFTTPPSLWWQGTGPPYPYGTQATLVGDVNGDAAADIIAVNSSDTEVLLSLGSHGSGFSAPQNWSSQPFFGSRATLVGDVNADGKDDLVAVNDSNTYVMTSTGSGFSAPSRWSDTAFYGSRATILGAVRNSSPASCIQSPPHSPELVAVNDPRTWEMTSTGTSFCAPEEWSSQRFYGTQATL